MPIQRHFLGWDRPGLHSAAEFLADRYTLGGELHLANVIIGLPGSRAGRRLLELLVEEAENRSLRLLPPEILTAGALPEKLYIPQRPFADRFTQRQAWTRAVQESDPELVERVARQLPQANDLFGWHALAELLANLHRELAADGFDFPDVVKRGSQLPDFGESPRWEALAAIARKYLDVLDELGQWDRQTARLVAIEQRECATEKDIVLIGTVDMNQQQRKMLNQVADRVTVLIIAPEESADLFDEHGCLIPERWIAVEIPISDDRIDVVDDPGDQADAVLRTLSDLDGKYTADEVSIGVPDASLAPYLQQRFFECDLPARITPGRPTRQLEPIRLLAAMADYLESGWFSALAALVRHPAIENWLRRSGHDENWLKPFDKYYCDYLPTAAPSPEWRQGTVGEIVAQLAELFGELSGPAKPVGNWSEPILSVMTQIYGEREFDRDIESDRMIIAACAQIRDAAQMLHELDSRVAPRVDGAAAIRLVLQEVGDSAVPPRANQSAIELLGWLELPLDDAPVLIVTGFNEGIIPTAQNSDLFLPNQLRRELGMEDNDRRYARDAYATCVLLASRRELQFIAGRRSTENDPHMPSRLIFACDQDALPNRVLAMCGSDRAEQPVIRFPGQLQPGGDARNLLPASVASIDKVESMRVTEFRDYLRWPYGYYLRHRLKLKELSDTSTELDPAAFGTLIHDVLKIFGRDQSGIADSHDGNEIAEFLGRALEREGERKFGQSPLPAVRVQIEMVRQRLRAFADWQATRRQEGWRIAFAEVPIESAAFPMPDEPMMLRGKIDRIDVNEQTGGWVVFDYKTGDSAKKPDHAHRKRNGEWIDLQLPLYRHLVRSQPVGLTDEVKLGYIVLPKDAGATKEFIAEWTDDDFASADETAAGVIRDIRAGEFGSPTDWPSDYFKDFEPLKP